MVSTKILHKLHSYSSFHFIALCTHELPNRRHAPVHAPIFQADEWRSKWTETLDLNKALNAELHRTQTLLKDAGGEDYSEVFWSAQPFPHQYLGSQKTIESQRIRSPMSSTRTPSRSFHVLMETPSIKFRCPSMFVGSRCVQLPPACSVGRRFGDACVVP